MITDIAVAVSAAILLSAFIFVILYKIEIHEQEETERKNREWTNHLLEDLFNNEIPQARDKGAAN